MNNDVDHLASTSKNDGVLHMVRVIMNRSYLMVEILEESKEEAVLEKYKERCGKEGLV